MAHSPFPWKTHPSDRTAVFDSDGLKVAATCAGHAFQSQRLEAEANAALIASIPDMVKALEEAVRVIDEAQSDYVSGSKYDTEWDARRDSFKADAAAALAAYRSAQK